MFLRRVGVRRVHVITCENCRRLIRSTVLVGNSPPRPLALSSSSGRLQNASIVPANKQRIFSPRQTHITGIGLCVQVEDTFKRPTAHGGFTLRPVYPPNAKLLSAHGRTSGSVDIILFERRSWFFLFFPIWNLDDIIVYYYQKRGKYWIHHPCIKEKI